MDTHIPIFLSKDLQMRFEKGLLVGLMQADQIWLRGTGRGVFGGFSVSTIESLHPALTLL